MHAAYPASAEHDLSTTATMSVQMNTNLDEKPTLTAINDDILIHIFSFANIEDVLAMRQVSNLTTVSYPSYSATSRLRIVNDVWAY